jgi:hypothetical protein
MVEPTLMCQKPLLMVELKTSLTEALLLPMVQLRLLSLVSLAEEVQQHSLFQHLLPLTHSTLFQPLIQFKLHQTPQHTNASWLIQAMIANIESDLI